MGPNLGFLFISVSYLGSSTFKLGKELSLRLSPVEVTTPGPEGQVHKVGSDLNECYRKLQTHGLTNSGGTFPIPV